MLTVCNAPLSALRLPRRRLRHLDVAGYVTPTSQATSPRRHRRYDIIVP
ncbi:hypothetical protein Barb4_00070 [Bacteroidales bacterium Barb4]|nr:hypothetical protein Barb4_00070 [Bacteroidales bacterium Barb4]